MNKQITKKNLYTNMPSYQLKKEKKKKKKKKRRRRRRKEAQKLEV